MNLPLDQLMAQKLEQLRTKLLDLSLANRLLNFKHTPQGRSYLRVIDDTPCLLWQRLMHQSLAFRSLPSLEEGPEDESQTAFLHAWQTASLSDQEYQKEMRSLEEQEESVQRTEKMFVIERALKDRLRQALGLPSRLSLLASLSEHAKQHGIHSSFDLPSTGPMETARSHEEIQLLLFPRAAEQQLSYVRDAAHQRLEETGINMLFCAFGFLQWYETAESQTSLYAPLLLLPVAIKRELRQHQFVYTLSALEEEPLVNLTLKEKLRQFGLVLPEWTEKDTPEEYWHRLEQVFHSQKRWKIRRWVTVGIFPFSRMAMYEDLDPSHPQLLIHPQVRHLLLGQEPGKQCVDRAQRETEIDSSLESPPLLISKVDSSQYAAICKALQNSDLVIKGPPGTGKSQTITNLIAASLARGENVLFVADKQAALNIVFSRLQEAGLADFCLELHSHQATRTSVIQSLKKRMEMSVVHSSASLEQKLKHVQEIHHSLDQYTNFMQRSLGHSQFTVQEILWAARAIADRAQVPSVLFKTYFEQGDLISPTHRQQAKKLLQGIEKAYHLAIGKEGNLHEHPWRGLEKSALSPFEIEELQEHLYAFMPLLDHIESHCQQVAQQYGIELHSFAEAEHFHNQLAQALSLTPNIQTEALVHCGNAEWRSQIEQLIQIIEQLHILSHSLHIDEAFLASFPLSVLEKMDKLCQSLPFTIDSMSRLEQEIEHTQRQLHGLEHIQQLSVELAQAFSLKENFTIKNLKASWSAVTYLACLPPSLLKWRHPTLYQEKGCDCLYKAHQQALHIQSIKQKLKKRFKLEKWKNDVSLSTYVKKLEQGHFWSGLSPLFRKARRFYQEMALEPSHQLPVMASELDELERYFTACMTFEQNPFLLELCGPYFKGIETDFATLAETAQFGCEVHKRFASDEPMIQAIRVTLLEGKEDHLQRLAALIKHPLAFALSHFLTSSHDNLDYTLVSLIDSWKSYQNKLLDLKECRERFLPPSFQFEHLAQWIAKGRLIQQMWSQLEQLRSVVLASAPSCSSQAFPFSQLQDTLLYWQHVRNQSLLSPLFPQLLNPCVKTVQEELTTFSHSLQHQLEAIHIQWKAIQTLGGVEEGKFFDHPPSFVQQTWPSLRSRLEKCLAYPELLNRWSLLGEAFAAAKQEGLENIYLPFIQEKKPLEHLCDAYDLVFYRSLARYAYTLDQGLLSRFNGIDQEHSLTTIAKLDAEILQLSKERLRTLLFERALPIGIGYGKKSTYTELALIKHEVSKQKRHLPIRQLMLRAKEAMRVFKPCFLMSPLSLAQYLPRESLTFDLVVIDEASQMRPEEAMGAISRAKRVVIVGDPMQLPPTDFFVKIDDPTEEEDEEDETGSHESILDLALALFPHTAELRWHYRSQHESLIAFSNHHFYNRRLMIFPCAHQDSSKMGVKRLFVPGIYQQGLNPIEAQAVIQAVLEFMQYHPERSLGIVTLNRTQRDLLLEEFEYAIQHSPQAAAYMARWESTLQAPFVKNLENVQGDERDVIFISMVYGPNSEDIVNQNFGPLNKREGHRRLNVLFTRARYQLFVFSSLLPDQIKAEGKHPGVGILKKYLEYASTGRLEIGEEKGREPESDFERWVADKIQAMGCQAVPQVGVAGYRIDIGVRHPSYPNGYLLGIECDGATYHSSLEARARDRLRQEILEKLGWTIYRIWSTDWFRDPLTQTKQLQKFIEQLVVKKIQSVLIQQRFHLGVNKEDASD